jgi:hypothetical protein
MPFCVRVCVSKVFLCQHTGALDTPAATGSRGNQTNQQMNCDEQTETVCSYTMM